MDPVVAPSLLEAVEVWQLVVGTLMLTMTAVMGLIVWLGKRMRAVSTDVASEALKPHAKTQARVQHVEERLGDLTEKVGKLHLDHSALNQRIGRMETSMEGVARKDDLATIYREFVEFRGSVTAELRQIGGMTHSIHAAILRQSSDEK